MTRALWALLVLASTGDLAIFLLSSGPLAPWLFGAAHPVLVAATLAILHRAAHDGEAPSLPAWVATAFGPVATLLTLALPFGGSSKASLLPAGPLDVSAAAQPISLGCILDERVRVPEPEALGSLLVTLRHGTLTERQAALETVVRSLEPRLSPIIAAALADPDQTIRALAASASAQIVQDLTRRRRELESACRSDASAANCLGSLLDAHGRHNVLLSAGARARLVGEGGALMSQSLGTPGLAGTCAALLAARDFAGLSRRCSEPDALALDRDDPLAPVIAYWGKAALA